MSDSGSGNTGGYNGGGAHFQAHAFDPVSAARIVSRRADAAGVRVPDRSRGAFGPRDPRPTCLSPCSALITLGLGWALFWLAWPASVLWAIIYYGASLGGPHSATLGMRVMDLELRTWYGSPSYFVLGAMHAVLFWVSISLLSPLVLLVGLFNGRRRLLHDILLGTVVINSSIRIPVPQAARTF